MQINTSTLALLREKAEQVGVMTIHSHTLLAVLDHIEQLQALISCHVDGNEVLDEFKETFNRACEAEQRGEETASGPQFQIKP